MYIVIYVYTYDYNMYISIMGPNMVFNSDHQLKCWYILIPAGMVLSHDLNLDKVISYNL